MSIERENESQYLFSEDRSYDSRDCRILVHIHTAKKTVLKVTFITFLLLINHNGM